MHLNKTLTIAFLAAVIAAISIIYFYEAGRGKSSAGVPLLSFVRGAPETIVVHVDEFEAGGTIPSKYTCDGLDASPPISIEGVPPGAKSLLVVVYDPDAPRGTFCHWVLYNVAPSTATIPEDIPKTPVVLGIGFQGANDFGKPGYGGPCPPRGDKPHRYVFLVAALDVEDLGLPPGAPCREVVEAAKGHVVGYGYTYGVYKR
ncbi:YbhB/YbcL family Raf kinase inhibitor-like protein [Pyrofollis japonicus]|uniref:YbhB/YbcL family Raf kinase inhibitor-like protein n=1 Tax=Pyrofollis japonicus TaxID=3060460 RepID=UPI0037CB7BE5